MANDPCIFTNEVSNFVRVAILLDYTKGPLIQLLEDQESLETIIQNNREKIDFLRNRNIIYKDEYDLINNGNIDPENLDIRFLCVLVRNFGNIPPPERGWMQEPGDDDVSLGADIVRIRLLRNMFHHVSSTKISDLKFNDISAKLKQIFARIGNQSGFETLLKNLESSQFVSNEILQKKKLEKIIKTWKLRRDNSLSCQELETEEYTVVETDENRLHSAIYSDDVDKFNRIFSTLAAFNLSNIVQIACSQGKTQIFLAVLKKMGSSFQFNHKDLSRACRGGSAEIVQKILENTEPIVLRSHEPVTNDKRCCIHHAAEKGFDDICKLLLKYLGEEILILMDKYGNTAIHLASVRGHDDVVRMIINSGNHGKMQIDAVNGRCLTPLHCASYFGQLTTVKLLLANGGDKTRKDKFGRSVLDLCDLGSVKSGHFDWFDEEFKLFTVSNGSEKCYELVRECVK